MDLIPGKLYKLTDAGMPESGKHKELRVHRYDPDNLKRAEEFKIPTDALILYVKPLTKKNKRKVLFLYRDQYFWLYGVSNFCYYLW